MMELFFEAIDVWLFRDGRSFDAGSDHRARSLFPPYPSVMQGVIRSHQLVLQKVDLTNQAAIKAAIGDTEDLRGLRLRGPIVARRTGEGELVRYYPQPADALSVKDSPLDLRPASPPRPPDDDGILTSATALVETPEGVRHRYLSNLLGLDDQPLKGESGLWLAEAELLRYLEGQTVRGAPGAHLFKREPRIGIGRDDAARVTREGFLYEAEFIRPQEGVGLWVAVEGYDGWPEEGITRIGGEGRGAAFRQLKGEGSLGWHQAPRPLPKRFKVYLATPACFTLGWRPQSWERFFEGEVKLVSAALHRYESIGGYDWAANAHKRARRTVPAGSVYYFACDGEARLAPSLPNQAFTDYGAEIGFGQMIIKEW